MEAVPDTEMPPPLAESGDSFDVPQAKLASSPTRSATISTDTLLDLFIFDLLEIQSSSQKRG